MAHPTLSFRDATSDAPVRTHFPEVVAGFEAMGFRQIGRLERVYLQGLEQVASLYAEEDRRFFCEHKAVPMVVLTAPNGNAFVFVDWWWGMPDVRIRTPMTDGSVVETRRAWDNAPALPMRLELIRRSLDMTEEQLLASVPGGGRALALATGAPAELWMVHEDRVASWARERCTQPVAGLDMEQAIGLSHRLSDHDFRAVQRVRLARFALFMALMAPPLLILFAPRLTHMGFGAMMATLLLETILVVTCRRRIGRVRYTRRMRPRFVR
jgi:hypothetical protein